MCLVVQGASSTAKFATAFRCEMSISAAVVATADFTFGVDSQGGVGYSSVGKDASTGDRFITGATTVY